MTCWRSKQIVYYAEALFSSAKCLVAEFYCDVWNILNTERNPSRSTVVKYGRKVEKKSRLAAEQTHIERKRTCNAYVNFERLKLSASPERQ